VRPSNAKCAVQSRERDNMHHAWIADHLIYIHQIKLFMPSDECVIHMHSQNYYGFLSLGLTSHKIMAFSTIQITCFSFYMFLAFFYFCMWIHVPIGIGFIQFLVFWGTSNNKDKILYMGTTPSYKMHAYMELAHIPSYIQLYKGKRGTEWLPKVFK